MFFCGSRAIARRGILWIGAVGACFLAVAGCSQQADVNYSPSAELLKLPEPFQKQVHAYLEQFYGTATQPRMMLPPENSPTAETSAKPDAGKPPKLVSAKDAEWLRRGMQVYQLRCAGCHGITGDSKGVAAEYLNPKPRDYRNGAFKFTSTPTGAQPRRSDLIRIIQHGVKGTSMPSFRWMDQDDLQPLVDYVTLLSERGQLERFFIYDLYPQLDSPDDKIPFEMVADKVKSIAAAWKQADLQLVMPLTPQPPFDEASVKRGREIFMTKDCWKCHGKNGRGQQPSDLTAAEQANSKDAWGNLSLAADLTSGSLHGGRRPVDLYRRIYSGINGSKMPAFKLEFEKDPADIWHLVHFILWTSAGHDVAGDDNKPVGEPTKPAAE